MTNLDKCVSSEKRPPFQKDFLSSHGPSQIEPYVNICKTSFSDLTNIPVNQPPCNKRTRANLIKDFDENTNEFGNINLVNTRSTLSPQRKRQKIDAGIPNFPQTPQSKVLPKGPSPVVQTPPPPMQRSNAYFSPYSCKGLKLFSQLSPEKLPTPCKMRRSWSSMEITVMDSLTYRMSPKTNFIGMGRCCSYKDLFKKALDFLKENEIKQIPYIGESGKSQLANKALAEILLLYLIGELPTYKIELKNPIINILTLFWCAEFYRSSHNLLTAYLVLEKYIREFDCYKEQSLFEFFSENASFFIKKGASLSRSHRTLLTTGETTLPSPPKGQSIDEYRKILQNELNLYKSYNSDIDCSKALSSALGKDPLISDLFGNIPDLAYSPLYTDKITAEKSDSPIFIDRSDSVSPVSDIDSPASTPPCADVDSGEIDDVIKKTSVKINKYFHFDKLREKFDLLNKVKDTCVKI